MQDYNEYVDHRDLGEDAPKILNESIQSNRYSIEVNYRTNLKEVEEAFAKLSLGYMSAAMKNIGYHVKVVFTNEPLRILVSTRNWDDGEWVAIVVYNPEKNCFVLATGSYNKDRKTVSISSSKKCTGTSAAEIVKELRNEMEKLKKQEPRGSNTLQAAQLKRGPKPSHLTKLKKLSGPWLPRH